MHGTRIEKSIVLRAPRERVWQAITESAQFGAWFGVQFEGPFVPGSWIHGRIVPTRVDPEVAKLQEPYRGKRWSAFVEQVEPMASFAFRWHPFAIDPAIDYSHEPTTLVTFTLHEVPDGTLLTITESGFDALPPERRGPALEANEGGWAHQTRLVEQYLQLEHAGRLPP